MVRLLRPAIFSTALGLLAAGLGSCGVEDDREATPALTVTTATVQPAAVPRRFTFPGTVKGKTRITISTKLMGEISSMPFEEGAEVSRGQVLASIRSADLKAKRAQIEAGRAEAEAAVTNVRANYERIRDLYAKKSATGKEMDEIQMAYDIARAKGRSVEEMDKEINDLLRYADLRSPIDGTIVGKYAETGDLASPGVPLLAVEDMKNLRVSFPVPESEITLIRQGGRVRVHIGALGADARFEGTIETVNPSGDPDGRQYEVRVGIAPPREMQVKPGMYATVTLETTGSETITVPQQILVRRGQLEGIFVLSAENEALLRWVRPGRKFGDGTVEILSGLAAGEEIITSRDLLLQDGVKVGVER
jgi:RND family efflux transporter MFP subunit